MAENDVDPVEPDASAETKILPTTPPASPPPPPASVPVDKSQYVVTPDAETVAATSQRRKAKPSKGALKPDSLSTDYVVVTDPVPEAETSVLSPVETVPVAAAPATEVLAPAEPGPAASEGPQIVYRDAPVPPKRHGNRSFGVLIALAATVVFAVLFAFAVLIILRTIRGFATISMLGNYGYWLPVGIFALALVLVALVINRAGWWAYIFGSAIVAIIVYVGSALAVAAVAFYGLGQDVTFPEALTSPTAIAAGIIAREVALWSGALIGRRGRTVKLRNRTEREEFDREQAGLVG